MLKHLGVVAGL